MKTCNVGSINYHDANIGNGLEPCALFNFVVYDQDGTPHPVTSMYISAPGLITALTLHLAFEQQIKTMFNDQLITFSYQ